MTQIKQENVTCRGINNFSNKTIIINLEIIINFYQKVENGGVALSIRPSIEVRGEYIVEWSPLISLSLLLSLPPSAPEMIRWGRV